MLFAQIEKQPAKFDCLKHPSVLQLEMLEMSPFHIVSAIIFFLAIAHTLSTYRLQKWAETLESKARKRTIPILILLFLSQVEVVFAFWAIPLFLAMAFFYNASTALEYINTRDYTETLFVVVILSLTASRPIVNIAKKTMNWCATFLGGSLSAWWFVLLTIGPILGSLITEVGAMTLCAMLLAQQFYVYHPSKKLAYATLGLLFVNVSVGGVLTNFASPAVLVLSHCWHWTNVDLLLIFGWKAVLGILLSNFVYWLYFRKEIQLLEKRRETSSANHLGETQVPHWITCIHVLFIVLTVWISHYSAVFIASFLFYLGFHQLTRDHQYPIRVRHPMLIGLFLAGLVIHGGLQGWWVVDLLYGRSPLSVMGITIGLAGFTDNTAISYLASLIPSWGKIFEYAIFTGIIAGGGLTVIANAPNPAGYAILKPHFRDGISTLQLFLAALTPTIILYAVFYFLGPLFIS
ncbi:MAG TPA: putative Na+/H+ antiporter [Chlamydiales bacterium]|nr:putative Na+/H+ antiporter [Chlamydiales bacterium]